MENKTVPVVTVALLNYNGRKLLEQFLPSLLQTEYPAISWLVVDNASTDDSVAWLRANFSQVHVLQLDANYGFAGGYNRALPHIGTPYLGLVNTDVEATPGWLTPLVERLEADAQLAVIQPKIRDWSRRSYFEYAGAAGGWIDTLGYPFCRGRLFHHLEEDQGQYDAFQYVAWATGACCVLKTEVANTIGLFQEGFFAHMEEIEFCWRLQAFGWKAACEPAAVVYHVGGGSLPKGNPRKTFLNARNSLLLLWLHLPSRQRIPKILLRLALDGLWALYALGKGDPKAVGAILKAHFDFYRNLGPYQRIRRSIYASSPPVWPGSGLFKGSVVKAFFLQGKKRWQELFADKDTFLPD